jgi:N-acetylmuramoyl-L-alanine amidase
MPERGIFLEKIKIIAATAVFCTLLALSGNKKIIVIDAGHGGWDPGKISRDKHEEAAINLAIAEQLQVFLENAGAVVFRTRVEDVALGDTKRTDLSARAAMPTDMQADIFVSIHQNAFPQSKVKGAQAFYYEGSEESRRLAEAVQARISSSLDPQNRMKAKGNQAYFLLKETLGPAIIVECGFLTNDEDVAKLITEEYRQKVAWAIYLGIMDYFASEIQPHDETNHPDMDKIHSQ